MHVNENNNQLVYGNKLVYLEGIIRDLQDGYIIIDLLGSLGSMKISKKMFITDYELKIGEKIGFNISFIEQVMEVL